MPVQRCKKSWPLDTRCHIWRQGPEQAVDFQRFVNNLLRLRLFLVELPPVRLEGALCCTPRRRCLLLFGWSVRRLTMLLLLVCARLLLIRTAWCRYLLMLGCLLLACRGLLLRCLLPRRSLAGSRPSHAHDIYVVLCQAYQQLSQCGQCQRRQLQGLAVLQHGQQRVHRQLKLHLSDRHTSLAGHSLWLCPVQKGSRRAEAMTSRSNHCS